MVTFAIYLVANRTTSWLVTWYVAVDLPFMCTFETDDCAMTVLNGNFTWTRHSGTTVTLDTGPSAAFEGLYYAYVEASFPRLPGDTA